MKRSIYQELIKWKVSSVRKPLVLRGARQVGKTYILKEFGRKEFANLAYFNFEGDPALASFFASSLEPKSLIEKLSLYLQKLITADDTLIVFDEVQVAPRALTSLKYFCEEAPEYYVVAAGSLLGVSVGRESQSFPVGKVNFLDMYPLKFMEYLDVMGASMLADMLRDKKDFQAIAEPLHSKLTDYFQHFLFLGGMPEVVATYVESKQILTARDVQSSIITAYQSDFSKYAEPTESIKISKLWESVPHQLAKENKKFKFSDVESNARYSRYEFALEWLRKAGLVYFCYHVTKPALPLGGYSEPNKCKLYTLDTGLLGSKLNLTADKAAFADKLLTEFKGALTENYVAKEIQPIFGEYLYYWTSGGSAEVDFIVQHKDRIFPVEVKSAFTKHKKSLISFKEKYNPPACIRLSPRNFYREKDFINVPLYAACLLDHVLDQV